MWSVNEFLPVGIKYTVDQNCAPPEQASEYAAGSDLRAKDAEVIKPGETKLIKTGIKAAIPNGYMGMVCSRSGLALKNSVFVLNAPGIVDSDYRGEWGVILHNAGKEDFYVNVGDRVAQMIIVQTPRVHYTKVETLDETARGEGGFGSTGKK